MAKDEEVMESLRGVLQDPDAMRRLSDMAQSLLGGTGDAASEPVRKQTGGLSLSGLGDERQIRLLEALEPYLSPRRQDTARRLMQLLRLLRVAEGLRAPGEGN